MRDLFVFLILFLLSLAVWSTGLFPPIVVQAVPPVIAEMEQEPVAVGPSPELPPPVSKEKAPLPVDSQALPEPAGTGEESKPQAVPPEASSEQSRQEDPEVRIQIEEEGNQSELAFQRIIIPSLKVDAKVVDVAFNGVTWDISDLGHDIARLGQVPGESTGENIVLAGHFSIGWTELGPFRYISRLGLGTPILVYTDRMIYTYQVREHAVVGDRDESVIAYTSEPQLTLLTCETWDEKTRKFLRRRVVFADLVRSESIATRTIQ